MLHNSDLINSTFEEKMGAVNFLETKIYKPKEDYIMKTHEKLITKLRKKPMDNGAKG